MKRLIPWVLALGLLAACSAAPITDVKNDPPPVPLAVTESQKPQPAVSYTVEMGTWTDSAAAEDGTPLAAYCFELPVLTVRRADGAAVTEPRTEEERQALTTAEVFNTKFGKWAAAEDFPEIVDNAEAERAWFKGEGLEWPGGTGPEPGGYLLELTCDTYQTDHIISVSGTYYSFTGGAHPNIWLLGWNFDLETGAFFGPEVLAADDLQEAVREELLRQAQRTAAEYETPPEEFFWQNYADILADWSSYAVSFDETGMTVAFSPYELAPYAAGPQEFHLSYAWLSPYLGDHGRLVLGLE